MDHRAYKCSDDDCGRIVGGGTTDGKCDYCGERMSPLGGPAVIALEVHSGDERYRPCEVLTLGVTVAVKADMLTLMNTLKIIQRSDPNIIEVVRFYSPIGLDWIAGVDAATDELDLRTEGGRMRACGIPGVEPEVEFEARPKHGDVLMTSEALSYSEVENLSTED